MAEAPYYFDRSFACETHPIDIATVNERNGASVSLFLIPGEDQNRLAALCMLNEVLTGVGLLRRVGLRLSMEQFPADRIVGVHGAGRELPFRFLVGDQQCISPDRREMEHAHAGLPRGFKRRPTEHSLDVSDSVLSMELEGARKGQIRNLTADCGFRPGPFEDLG